MADGPKKLDTGDVRRENMILTREGFEQILRDLGMGENFRWMWDPIEEELIGVEITTDGNSEA